MNLSEFAEAAEEDYRVELEKSPPEGQPVAVVRAFASGHVTKAEAK